MKGNGISRQEFRNWLILLVAVVIMSSAVNAVSIGISPGRVRFENVLRGGYAERVVALTTAADDDLSASFRMQGDIKDWISFEPNQTGLIIKRGAPYKLKIIVRPPADVRAGNYTGSIEFLAESSGGLSGRAGTLVKTAVTLLINIEVTGKEVIACRAGGFSFQDSEIGFPFEYRYTIYNDGNVRLKPTITIDIWDQLQNKLLFTTNVPGNEVLPTTQSSLTGSLSSTLPEGQYWVDIGINECDKARSLLTFSVLEKGAIADKGELISIQNKPWAYTNETIQITAKFQNIGQRSVTSRFKGTIRLDDRIVQLIETDDVIVPAGEPADFDIFFTPKLPGRYTISGRVVYNRKLTFEKSSVFNINPAEETSGITRFSFLPDLIPLSIYIIIIITIAFIIRKIMKGRKTERFKKKQK